MKAYTVGEWRELLGAYDQDEFMAIAYWSQEFVLEEVTFLGVDLDEWNDDDTRNVFLHLQASLDDNAEPTCETIDEFILDRCNAMGYDYEGKDE